MTLRGFIALSAFELPLLSSNPSTLFPQGGSVKRVRPTDSPADRKVCTPPQQTTTTITRHTTITATPCSYLYLPAKPATRARVSPHWVLRGEPSYPALRGVGWGNQPWAGQLPCSQKTPTACTSYHLPVGRVALTTHLAKVYHISVRT